MRERRRCQQWRWWVGVGALLAVCYCTTLFTGLTLLDDQIEDDASSFPETIKASSSLSPHLCQSPPRVPRCSTGPCQLKPTSRSVVVVGALSFIGAQLTSEFASNGLNVHALEHDSCISADEDGLVWYRKEQLWLHHGLAVTVANLSNQTQLEDNLLYENGELDRPAVVVYVPPVVGLRGEVNNEMFSKHLESFVVILETLRQVSPLTRVMLSSSLSASGQTSHDSHVTLEQVWMDTFELTLSTYHSLYGVAMTIVRSRGVYGPWSEVAMAIYQFISQEPPIQELRLCSYIKDMKKVFIKALSLNNSSCEVLDLGCFRASLANPDIAPLPVPSPGSEYTYRTLGIAGVELPASGLRKSLSWAKSYLHHKASSPDKNVVLSSYFTSVQDSQRGRQMTPNRFQYMREWLVSVKALCLQAVVFHDGLEASFQHRLVHFYPNVSFHLVPSLKGRSTNDARFYAYLDYLEHHHEIARVLLTDISDVKFQRDPFELMSLLGEEWLYIGTDIDIFPSMRSMPWLSQRLRGCFGNSSLERGHPLHSLLDLDTVYNAGAIGGRRELMVAVLHRIVGYLNATPPQLNCNMPAVNFAIHEHFYDRVFTGFPLSSRFLWQQTSPKGVYIVHK